MWTATKISSWVADTSTSGFKKMLNAETPSSVTIASTSVSKAPTTVLHGTAAPTAAPDSFIVSYLRLNAYASRKPCLLFHIKN